MTLVLNPALLEMFRNYIENNSRINSNSKSARPESIWLINQLMALQSKLKQIQAEQEKLNLFESNSGLDASEELIKKEIEGVEAKILGKTRNLS